MNKRPRGFSLVEVMVGALITLVMVSALYTFFSSAFKHFTRGTILLDLEKESRIVMERIKNDIRGACTRGSVRPNSPADTPYYKIIAEDPLPKYGHPKDTLTGERDYIHGQTLKFFKLVSSGTAHSPPTSALITWTSRAIKEKDGQIYLIVERIEDRDGAIQVAQPLRIPCLEELPPEKQNSLFLYFVVFNVDTVTRALVDMNEAAPEELGTGGRTYVRILFRITKRVDNIQRSMELITVVNPRQINLFDQDPYWKQNSHTMVEISTDLLPSD